MATGSEPVATRRPARRRPTAGSGPLERSARELRADVTAGLHFICFEQPAARRGACAAPGLCRRPGPGPLSRTNPWLSTQTVTTARPVFAPPQATRTAVLTRHGPSHHLAGRAPPNRRERSRRDRAPRRPLRREAGASAEAPLAPALDDPREHTARMCGRLLSPGVSRRVRAAGGARAGRPLRSSEAPGHRDARNHTNASVSAHQIRCAFAFVLWTFMPSPTADARSPPARASALPRRTGSSGARPATERTFVPSCAPYAGDIPGGDTRGRRRRRPHPGRKRRLPDRGQEGVKRSASPMFQSR